jgi:hypothetical protein
MTVVITNCTNRKRIDVGPILSASSLSRGSIATVAKQWKDRLRKTRAVSLARDVYCGRSYREAEVSANCINSPLYIVSAGLGVVSSHDTIPSYDLTVSTGSVNTISLKIVGNAAPQTWWSLVSKDNPYGTSLNEVLNEHSNELFLIALSRPYIELVIDELLLIDKEQSTRIRFFGKQLDQVLPESLISCWMPYDDRLDCIGNGYAGTQSDMAQRALHHFVSEVLVGRSAKSSAKSHKEKVLKALSSLTARSIPKRTKLSDIAIFRVIRKNWSNGQGQSSELLRMLRHDLGIACEQSRFRNIYYSVKASLEKRR